MAMVTESDIALDEGPCLGPLCSNYGTQIIRTLQGTRF